MEMSAHATGNATGPDASDSSGTAVPHFGDALRSMKERAEALGGRVANRKPSPAYDEPWDMESADALMRIYDCDAQDMSGQVAPPPVQHAPPMAATRPVTAGALDHHAVARLANDPGWLEARLADLAERVERSIAAVNPTEAIADLGIRFADFETRVSGALSNVASRADLKELAVLGTLEERIDGFAAELHEQAKQFARLDAIEAHLRDLSQIAAQAYAEPNGRTYGETARVQASDAGAAHQPAADIRALLESFAADRQRIDRDTANTLDTIQEALVRLIDRADQMELRPEHHAGTGQVDAHAHEPHEQPERFDDAHTEDAYAPHAAEAAVAPELEQPAEAPVRAAAFGRLPRHVTPQPVAEERATEVPVAATLQAAAPSAPAAGRKDLESTALRTQMRAAMVAAPEPAMDIPAVAADATSPPAPRDGQRRRTIRAVNPGRRALTIAAIGIAAVGIGYVTADFLTASAPELPPAAKVAAPAPARAAAMPSASAPIPVPVPLSAAGIEPAQKRDAGLAPAFGDAPPVRPTRTTPPRPSAEAVPETLPPPVLPKPRSIPETGSDDLSQNTAPTGPAPKRVAAQFGPGAPPASAANSAMGISVDTSTGTPRPEDIARMMQRRQLAETPIRMGATMAAPPLGISGGGTSGAIAEAPNAGPRAPVAIVPVRIDTGSTSKVTEPVDTEHATRMPGNLPAAIGPQTLRTAALKGDPSAEFEVAVRYAEGKGVAQSFDEAMVWYQRAANHGFAPAQYRLGTLYERGLATGVDLQRARVWYQRAAEQGNVKAMHNLAVLSAGRKSTAPDYEAASVWFTAAAERGLSDSQFNLAVLMENGLGVTKDIREAYKWFALAARSGDKEAVRRRDMLAGKLETADFKAVEQEVTAWRAMSVDVKVNDARVAGDQWRGRQEASGQ